MNSILPERATDPSNPGSDSFLIASEKSNWLDRWTDFWSERFNPILVKETRQALKSRQFVWSFFLLLLAVVVWTLWGMVIGEDEKESMGPRLLHGYLIILGFPLGIVVPFATFRSLLNEFDDGTISLISISTLSSWQIVLGKLGSTVIQMVVYLSVLAPCIMFTFLLQGVGIDQMVLSLGFCIAVSLLLSSLGLFLASIVRTRFLSILTSIAFIVLTAWLYWVWWFLAGAMAFSFSGEMAPATPGGQFAIFSIGMLIATSLFLLLATAASQISFASDNRSTWPRMAMLVQQTSFLAIATLGTKMSGAQVEMPVYIGFVYGHYWLVMGFLMLGESPHLSHRVRRSIPRTFLGKSVGSLFLPGPGRGLLFALTNIWVCAGFMFAIDAWHQVLPAFATDQELIINNLANPTLTTAQIYMALETSLINVFYLSVFLCLTYLIIQGINRWRQKPVGSVVSFAVGAILVALPAISGALIQINLEPNQFKHPYSAWQWGNWYWTLLESIEAMWLTHSGACRMFALVMLIPVLLAVLAASRELVVAPVAMPERVKQELVAARKARRLQTAGPVETIDDIFNEPRPEPSEG